MTSLRTILSPFLAVVALTGCPANPGPQDSGSNGDGAADMGTTDVGTPLVCNDAGFAVSAGDAGTCFKAEACSGQPWCPGQFANSATTANFVITQLELTRPPALVAISSLLNSAVTSGTFFWGAQFDLAGNTVKTGAMRDGVIPNSGTGFLLSQFEFYNNNALPGGDLTRWDPQSAPIEVVAGRIKTTDASPIARLSIPVFSEPTGGGPRTVLAELPLQGVTVTNVLMADNKNCIGTSKRAQFSSCGANQWNTRDTAMMPYGTIRGVITTADARVIRVDALNKTLCEVISGLAATDGGVGCDDTTLMGLAAGKKPDVTTPSLGWTIEANFAAVSANIR